MRGLAAWRRSNAHTTVLGGPQCLLCLLQAIIELAADCMLQPTCRVPWTSMLGWQCPLCLKRSILEINLTVDALNHFQELLLTMIRATSIWTGATAIALCLDLLQLASTASRICETHDGPGLVPCSYVTPVRTLGPGRQLRSGCCSSAPQRCTSRTGPAPSAWCCQPKSFSSRWSRPLRRP